MGEAKQRRASGLGFKSESREAQKIKKSEEKKVAEDIVFEESLRDYSEWEGLNEDGTTDYFRWNEERQEDEKWNHETLKWAPAESEEEKENKILLERVLARKRALVFNCE
jgi:hypothetical protein